MNVPIGSWRPNTALETAMRLQPHHLEEHHYPEGEAHKLRREQMAANFDLIVGMTLRGQPTFVIAAGLGVSRETIDGRLRPLGFKNPPGVRGRPAKLSQPHPSRSTDRGSATCRC